MPPWNPSGSLRQVWFQQPVNLSWWEVWRAGHLRRAYDAAAIVGGLSSIMAYNLPDIREKPDRLYRPG